MHGYGTFINEDKMKYEGQFCNDIKQGYGTYSWTDGRKYSGWWYQGK